MHNMLSEGIVKMEKVLKAASIMLDKMLDVGDKSSTLTEAVDKLTGSFLSLQGDCRILDTMDRFGKNTQMQKVTQHEIAEHYRVCKLSMDGLHEAMVMVKALSKKKPAPAGSA